MIPEHMKEWTLGQAEIALQQGRITQEVADSYIHLWNTSTVRFTEAYRVGYDIRQKDKG